MMERIKTCLKKFKGRKVATAYSGGVDSSRAAFAAGETWNAVTVKTEFTPSYMLKDAVDFAEKYGLRHKVTEVSMLDDIINKNPEDRRCFCTKKIIGEESRV
ncbi:MAG: hypothetical protein A7316_07380 [Candidatus Altiarchaeales archaeon WOR_SM1_86-2]|nr:MAG: hypothetical protein A7316_07380 [Candidatus Altiarchaeales archaeon WOR_SM1_86-2]